MKDLKNEKNTENEREIRFCKQFKNRYLTRFYGFVQKENKVICLIYEYLVNDTLKSHVKQINEMFALDAIIRISEGIKYLHSNQLIHNDLKLENILLDNNFIPYISDFPTICHLLTNEEKENNIEYTKDIGSTIYISPEQYYGDDISYPTDVYSFGILTYFLYEKNVDAFGHKNSIKILYFQR